jgi:Holliday junction resolvasome RuvABC endonuclease subunit
MKILALDVGTHCGWAALSGGSISSGCEDFTLKRGDSPGLKFLKFSQWFFDQLNKFRPDLVVYEQAHFRGGYATELLVAFTTRIMEFCAARGIEYAAVYSGTLKKWAVGDGRADKPTMMRKMVIHMGRPITNEHEADALWLLFYAKAHYQEAKNEKEQSS